MTIQKPPIMEPIQPMPPAWAIWFQNLVAAFNALPAALTAPVARILFGSGSGVTSSADLTYDGTLKAPLAQFGTDANHSGFDADGTVHFTGDAAVWDDINISILPPTNAAGVPDVVAFNGDATLLCYSFHGTTTQVHKVASSMEILHGYREGSDIHFHVHWYPSNSTVANVKWILVYTWFNRGTVPGASTTVSSVVATPGVAWQEQTTSWTIDGTGKTMGSRLVFELQRNPAAAEDTYTGGAAVTDMGVHYEIDQVGSREILVK